jgi:hypothetical protein
MVTTSDGYIVNNFRREKYEKALARFKELHEINNLYITDEEEQNFRFEEVDFEALNREVDNISTSTELMEMRKKVYNLMEYQTEEMQEKIKETIIKRLDDMLVSASFIDKQNNIGTRENEKNIASKCKSFREKFKVQVHSIKKMQNIAKDIKHNRGIER